jgi:hypothetical protein
MRRRFFFGVAFPSLACGILGGSGCTLGSDDDGASGAFDAASALLSDAQASWESGSDASDLDLYAPPLPLDAPGVDSNDGTRTPDLDDAGGDVALQGPSDAAMDAPFDALAADGAGPCVTQGTELCDGFESGSIDARVWGVNVTDGASLTVDTQHVHSGTYALHVRVVPGQQSTAQVTDSVTFPAKNNLFYVRAFFYFDPDLPADNMGGVHMAYLLATGNNTLGYVQAGLGSAGNKQYLGYSEYYGDGPNVAQHGATFTEFGPDSPTQIVPMTWICLELMQGGDATTTSRRVWVNGNELTEQQSDYSGRPPPTFDQVSVGVLQYHVTPILSDVWVDDVRVSSARIGCGTSSP